MSEEYKIYVLEKPFSFHASREYKKFLGYLLSLRMDGYSAVHGQDVVPIDQYDYFATNILLYKEVKNEIIPLACSRIIRYSDCLLNNIEFFPLKLLKDKKNKKTRKYIEELLNERAKKGLDVTFDSSFTISPELNNSMESQKVVKHIMGAVFNWHKEYNENCFLASATIKVKTGRLFSKLGLSCVCVKTDRLFSKLGLSCVCDDSEYKLQSVNNEPAVMMKFNNSHTNRTNKWMKSSEFIWDNRNMVTSPKLQIKDYSEKVH